MARPKKVVKKREKKNVPVGIAHIQASFNNTIITFTASAGPLPARAVSRVPASPPPSLPRLLPKLPPARLRTTACAPWVCM